jgi:fatty acid desaturase
VPVGGRDSVARAIPCTAVCRPGRGDRASPRHLLSSGQYLLVQAPTALLAGAVGVWLFYVQHQFEDTYWQSNQGWSCADAALRGSSYLKLPKMLQFFTGNIGLHHVHHLSTRIPNYACSVRTTRMRSSTRCRR